MKLKYSLIPLLALLMLVLHSCGTKKSAQTGDQSTEIRQLSIKEPKQSEFTPEGYVEAYRDLAIIEMKRSGVPASITLAQGMLESAYGKSYLAKEGKNHFGIKCKAGWPGKKVYLDDDAPDECFRAYNSVLESYKDHSDFLRENQRYHFLFDYDITDYQKWCKGLLKAGYATNPRYASILIKLIEKYELHEYDSYFDKEFKSKLFVEKTGTESSSQNNASNYDFEQVSINGIPAVIASGKHSFREIAKRNEMMPWEIFSYNDLPRDTTPQKGMVLYLKPKRGKANRDFHSVKKGQSMQQISQEYGVKLKKLYRINLMEEGQEPKAGEQIALNKKVDKRPLLRSKGELGKERVEIAEGKKKDINPLKDDVPLVSNSAAVNPKRTTDTGTEKLGLDAESENEENEIPLYSSSNNYKRKFKSKHKVEPGQTLYGIASRYDVEIDSILAWNNKTDYNLKVGEELKIDANPVPIKPLSDKPQFHYAGSEETLYSISLEYNIPVDSLVAWNNLKTFKLDTNQKLIVYKPLKDLLPGNGDTSFQRHLVAPGETLYSISRKYETSVDQLKSLNKLDDHAIQPGMSLKIRAKNESTDKLHIVEAGDTLYQISKKYNVSVEEIKSHNSLKDSNLSPGQELLIP